MSKDTDDNLNDIWTVYFHDPYDTDWTYSSYKQLGSLSNIETFWNVHTVLKSKVHQGMFFIMREHVFPCWDDPYNREGGCMSIKVLKQDIDEFWEELCIRLLGETLVVGDKNTSCDCINGISSSPKKSFCIVKIWVKDDTLNQPEHFNIPPNYHGDVIFKLNKESIDCNTKQ